MPADRGLFFKNSDLRVWKFLQQAVCRGEPDDTAADDNYLLQAFGLLRDKLKHVLRFRNCDGFDFVALLDLVDNVLTGTHLPENGVFSV